MRLTKELLPESLETLVKRLIGHDVFKRMKSNVK